MSRCKACDAIMTESELKRIDYNTGEHLDLCYECMVESERAVRDSEVEEVVDVSELGFDISNN